jgi:hypothetical protein
MELSMADFLARAEKLYGPDKLNWKFKCTGYKNEGNGPKCGNIQSAASIIEQNKKGIASLRQGLLKKGDSIDVDCECYAHDCNWVAYGLFNSCILVILDPAKPHSTQHMENCHWIFPLADDPEMLKAAGVK